MWSQVCRHASSYPIRVSNPGCLFSMGGLLAADALLEFVRTRPDKRAPLWPKIVACIAYDTPVSLLCPISLLW